MQPAKKEAARGSIGVLAALAFGFTAIALTVPAALASAPMPVARQNARVQKYCAVCHTDAAPNGGFSLPYFDAAHAAPSLAALLATKMKSEAMGAAGLPMPDMPTIGALVAALASEITGATVCHVNRSADPVTKASILTASILRQAPAPKNAGEAAMYRIVLVCKLPRCRCRNASWTSTVSSRMSRSDFPSLLPSQPSKI